MKTYKELLNEASYQSDFLRELSERDMKALKKCILDIYIKVYDLCIKNNLRILLAEGSCLGAVRHKGFIPWDDDMDVMMPRADYDKFIKLCENGALGDNFVFRYPHGKQESSSLFLKIYMKDTLITGIEKKDAPFPSKVFLDIFPIEGIPSNKFRRKFKGLVANTLRLIGNTVMENDLMSKELSDFYKTNKQLYLMAKRRRMIGYIFSFISHQRWVRWYDSWVRCDDMSNFIGIPTARKLYDGETLPVSSYLPPVEGEFEGLKVWLPAKTHEYLENLYGDYMQIPPIEKRERHFIREFDLPERYYMEKE